MPGPGRYPHSQQRLMLLDQVECSANHVGSQRARHLGGDDNIHAAKLLQQPEDPFQKAQGSFDLTLVRHGLHIYLNLRSGKFRTARHARWRIDP